jgi:hypothetical protein
MIEYLYFVKWLDDNNIAEEVFEFFDEAKSFAMNILSQQPEIHQTEIIRNDFGECVDSNEIGKVWSWEELMDDIPENTETDGDFHIFTRGDFAKYADGYDPDNDPEFDDRDITFETDCIECEHPLDEDYDKPKRSRRFFYTAPNGSSIILSVHLCKFDNNYEFLVSADFPKEQISLDLDNEKLSAAIRSSYTYLSDMDGDDAHDALFELTRYFDEIKDSEIIDTLINLSDEHDYQFLNSLKESLTEGKSIKDLVEEMEENEDTVECKWCEELFDKSECRYEVNIGWLCPQCQAAIKSRGETLTFRESANKDYYGAPRELSSYVDDAIHHLFFDLGKDYDEEEFNDDVIGVIERWYEDELCIPYDDPKRYENWYDAVSCEVSRQLTTNPKYKKLISEHSDSTNLTEASKIEFSKYDNYEPGKYINLTTSGNYDQDVDVVLSCEEVMEALIELVDDEYIQYQTDETDELRTVDALRKANKLEEFFADDFGTHIHNYKDEILEYYEEACSEAIEDSDNELETEWKNEGPGGGAFSSWDDYYRYIGIK